MPDVTLKRGDVGRILTGQFTDANGPVNCSTNTARKIFMRKWGLSTLKINSTFTFTNAATGSWSYTLQAPDIDTKGQYLMEFEVTLASGQVITFPSSPDKLYYEVLIQDDLD